MDELKGLVQAKRQADEAQKSKRRSFRTCGAALEKQLADAAEKLEGFDAE